MKHQLPPDYYSKVYSTVWQDVLQIRQLCIFVSKLVHVIECVTKFNGKRILFCTVIRNTTERQNVVFQINLTTWRYLLGDSWVWWLFHHFCSLALQNLKLNKTDNKIMEVLNLVSVIPLSGRYVTSYSSHFWHYYTYYCRDKFFTKQLFRSRYINSFFKYT